MTENLINVILNSIFIMAGILIAIGIGIKILKLKFVKEKRTAAQVINKYEYTQRVLSKLQAPFDKRRYVVTFLYENNRKSFYVSKEEYNKCELHRKGTLVFKGTHFIGFYKI